MQQQKASPFKSQNYFPLPFQSVIFIYFKFHTQSMSQIITHSCNIWLQREAVRPRGSLVQSFNFSPACLLVWTSKTNGGVKTQGGLQRDCFLLLLLLHHAQLRRVEPDCIKKCVSEKRWLIQRTSQGGRHFTSQGNVSTWGEHKHGCTLSQMLCHGREWQWEVLTVLFLDTCRQVAVHCRWHFEGISCSFRTQLHKPRGTFFYKLKYVTEYFDMITIWLWLLWKIGYQKE